MIADRIGASAAGIALTLLIGMYAPADAAGSAIVNPWVTTDRSINCFDSRSIIADLIRGLDNDPQETAIAVYSFFQRTMFPYANRNEYPFPENNQQHQFDFVRVVNVYGYSLCSQNSVMFASLLEASGLFEAARAVSVPGHATAEVKWGGRWHFMDPIVGAYVFRRERREIASIEEIIADTTLFTRAVEEGRASMPFCRWDGEEVYPEASLARNDAWFTYRKYGLDFLLQALPEHEPWPANEPVTHTMAFSLRPGFRLTRLWDHLPGMYNLSYDYFRQPFNLGKRTPSPELLPPHHPDGGKEALDTLNFPLIEPYSKTVNGRDSYHYYANGVLVYEDKFTDRRISVAADSVAGLSVVRAPDKAGGMLRCLEGSSEGAAFFTFEAPYVFVGGTVSGRAQVTRGSSAAVYMDADNGKSWLCLGMVDQGGSFSFEIPAGLLDERYRFRLALKLFDKSASGSVNIREFKAEAVCQLNMYSLPFLVPGKNRVTVLADEIPQASKLAVTYKWREQGWDREDRRLISTGGESYTIEVAGDRYPRMKEITLECIPE